MNRPLFLGLSMLGALLLLGPVQAQTTDIGTDQIINDTAAAGTNINFTSNLTLTYGQYAYNTGITVNVQTSPDLITWTTLNSTQYTNQPTGKADPNGDPYMQIEVPFTGSRQFVRLNVSSS